jgi:site-specific recombinase XerD
MTSDLTKIDATPPGKPRDDALEKAIQTRLADLEHGKYRRNNAFVLRQFAEFLRRDDSIEVKAIEDITAQTLRVYARALKRAVENNDIAASTAEQYWALVSSFLGWSVREGLHDSNPVLC